MKVTPSARQMRLVPTDVIIRFERRYGMGTYHQRLMRLFPVNYSAPVSESERAEYKNWLIERREKDWRY